MMEVIVSLFEESGNMVRPYANAGYECHCFDLENKDTFEAVGKGKIYYHKADLKSKITQSYIISLNPCLIFSFPPCTDLAVSGAKHFQIKYEVNPNYRKEALHLVMIAPILAEVIGCNYMLENPVSVISTEWRKPDFKFHPYDYGGYLPEDDKHPRWPDYIAARDAYPKLTCLWTSPGFKMPIKKPVPCSGLSTQFKKLGGKSAKTKQIRSETPRGFAKAVFMFNSWNNS